MLGIALLMLVLVVLCLPSWPHSAHWGSGWAPSGLFGLALAAIVVLMILGRV